MSRTLQFRRYANTVVANTVGADGELVIDNTNNYLTIHDGITPGGVRSLGSPGISLVNNRHTVTLGNTGYLFLANSGGLRFGDTYQTTAFSSFYINTINQTTANVTALQNASANSETAVLQGGLNSANANIISLQVGVSATDSKMQSAYNKANNALSNGTLTYAASGLFAVFGANSNTYQQVVLQNSNTGTQASADFIVSNFYSTDGFLYGDFGINGSNFAGLGSLGTANNVYLYASNTDLAIGTSSANAIHFVVNGSITDAMSINSTGTVNVAGNLYAGSGLGYTTGSGGAITQLTSRTTGVTLNKPSGQITLTSNAMATGTSNTFVFTNSSISANDFIMINHWSGGTLGNYTFASNTSVGQSNVTIRAINTVTAEAPVLQYVVIKGAAS
jgi:hypothetical protein